MFLGENIFCVSTRQTRMLCPRVRHWHNTHTNWTDLTGVLYGPRTRPTISVNPSQPHEIARIQNSITYKMCLHALISIAGYLIIPRMPYLAQLPIRFTKSSFFVPWILDFFRFEIHYFISSTNTDHFTDCSCISRVKVFSSPELFILTVYSQACHIWHG